MATSAHGRLSALSGGAPGAAPLSSWYTQGPSDGFGDRLLMFDNAATGPLELLRVRPDFSFVPEFETRIRERLERLAAFNHPGFAHARAIDRFDNDEGLTVVSTHVPGTRLSELFPAARPRGGMHPAVAHWVLGELMASAAALHRYPGVAHGALAPERIAITADRHIVISDYIFGDALNAMRLPAERLWNEFRVVHDPRIEGVTLDQRGDVVQLALIALSLVVGHRVTADEYARDRQRLVDEFTTACERQMTTFGRGLATWLGRALDPEGFRSAVEANRELIDLTGTPAIEEWSTRVRDAQESGHALVASPSIGQPERAADPTAHREEPDEPQGRSWRFGPFHWMAAALAIIGVVQGAVIAGLVFRRAEAPPAVAARMSPETADASAERTDRAVSTAGAALPEPTSPPPAAPTPAPGAVIASSQGNAGSPSPVVPGEARNGSLRLVSPIDLDIMSGTRRLGSSSGAIALGPGSHDLTFTNASLGVRITQSVRIDTGRVATLNVEPPRGALSANAEPWAQVAVDGRVIGETPLANIAVAVGEHEVVFRHPQLGERRQKVVVRADSVARVSARFQE